MVSGTTDEITELELNFFHFMGQTFQMARIGTRNYRKVLNIDSGEYAELYVTGARNRIVGFQWDR